MTLLAVWCGDGNDDLQRGPIGNCGGPCRWLEIENAAQKIILGNRTIEGLGALGAGFNLAGGTLTKPGRNGGRGVLRELKVAAKIDGEARVTAARIALRMIRVPPVPPTGSGSCKNGAR